MIPLSNNRILVIDDNPSIHEDFLKILGGGVASSASLVEAESILFGNTPERDLNRGFELDFAFQGQEALEKVEAAIKAGKPYALAFIDVRMPPGWDGIETIARLWQADPGLQTVICTAYSDYSWDDMVARLDASDNLLILKKPFDNIEVLQLAHAMTRKWEVTQQANMRMDELDKMVADRTSALQYANESLRREMAERTLAEEGQRVSQECFSKAFHASPIPLAIQELRTMQYIDVNQSFLRMTGFQREEAVGATPISLDLKMGLEPKLFRHVQERKSVSNIECTIETKSQGSRQILLSMEMLALEGQSHVLVMMQDISERLHLESQLRHSQKMEAVGQLAAGIAHDFNNILTIIGGYTSLQLESAALDESSIESLNNVAEATERAAMLTRQLLTFSRKQIMQLKVLDLNELLNELSQMLRRIIGEDIVLVSEYAPELPSIFADPTNMEQIVMNLAVNARDAMRNGGLLTIRTYAETIAAEDLPGLNPDARPGEFICLVVSDSGCGMPPSTLSHIFEPFFTTKPVGKGTGMGLATVYGIVKQHEGWIDVHTELGKGTCFEIHLPVTKQTEQEESRRAEEATLPNGKGRLILVVEDDAAIRQMVQEILEHYNYEVLTANNAEEAMVLWKDYSDKIELLLTDLVMPGTQSGRELAERLAAERPELKVVFSTGYSAELFGSNLLLQEGTNYLPKPYHALELARIIQRALDAN